ncbi:hypothetical protein LGN12_31130, partial [Burkholderia multivorans]|nr:hypothetical protein [Burkholderia multivorans]
GLGFLQKPDDLLFRKALLHVRLLLRKRTLLDSGWPCLQGAGHACTAHHAPTCAAKAGNHPFRVISRFVPAPAATVSDGGRRFCIPVYYTVHDCSFCLR